MAKRDPNKSARNRMIKNLTAQLLELLPTVLEETRLSGQAALNAMLGSKNDEFFDLRNDIIYSQDQFVVQWLTGLKKATFAQTGTSVAWIWNSLKKLPAFKKYTLLFLERSYLNHFDELSKTRPQLRDSELWIGQKNAHYGLLITPRFAQGEWENDRSEIRAFRHPYFTIGHVLETGLVVPGKDKRITFQDLDQYLDFFEEVLVRQSGSTYQKEIASFYSDFVRGQLNSLEVPLLIPEFRYGNLATKHIYRLDFLVINPYTFDKTGFELSPWSTHGYLYKTKTLNQHQINQMAKDNFAKEMKRHRAFFMKHEIMCLIFTDDELKAPKQIFDESIFPCLEPEKPKTQLSFQIMEELLAD